MFLLDDARCNENFQAVTREVHTILTKSHAEVFAAEKWDERKLCYPIEGRTRAVYYLVRFTAPTGALGSIERDCQLNDTILRVLLLRDEESEKLHKAGLLAVRPGEPGEPIQSLMKKPATVVPPSFATPYGPGSREGEGPGPRPEGDRADDRRPPHHAD
jgi:ribosomal protein S6